MHVWLWRYCLRLFLLSFKILSHVRFCLCTKLSYLIHIEKKYTYLRISDTYKYRYISCLRNVSVHMGLNMKIALMTSAKSESITKTCLYNFDPLKPHFYIVKLGFTGVYIIFFLFLLKNIDCGYSSTHNLCFEQKYEKYLNFLSENF